MRTPVRILQQQIDSLEFSQWLAMERVYPWGEERADLRAGIVASTMANCHRSPNKDPFSPVDFMWKYKPDVIEPQTPEVLQATIDAVFGAMIGKKKEMEHVN